MDNMKWRKMKRMMSGCIVAVFVCALEGFAFGAECRKEQIQGPCGTEKKYDCQKTSQAPTINVSGECPAEWRDWAAEKVNALLNNLMEEKCGLSSSIDRPIIGMYVNCECYETSSTADRCKEEMRQGCYQETLYQCLPLVDYELEFSVTLPIPASPSVGVSVPIYKCEELPGEPTRAGEYTACKAE